jgi:hypothetical protein
MLANRMEYASTIMYNASSDMCLIVLNALNTQNTLGAQLCYSAASQTQSSLNLSITHVPLISHSNNISQRSNVDESSPSTTSLASFQELHFGFGSQLSTGLQHT